MSYRLKLKEVRKQKQLSQIKLAELMGVSQSVISEFEKGNYDPSLERLVQMAKILQVSLDELVDFNIKHDEYSNSLAKIMNDKEED